MCSQVSMLCKVVHENACALYMSKMNSLVFKTCNYTVIRNQQKHS